MRARTVAAAWPRHFPVRNTGLLTCHACPSRVSLVSRMPPLCPMPSRRGRGANGPRLSAMEEFAAAHQADACHLVADRGAGPLFNKGRQSIRQRDRYINGQTGLRPCCRQAYAAPLSCTPSTRRNPRVARLSEGKVRRSSAVSGVGRAALSPRVKLRVVCRVAGRCRRGGRERDLACDDGDAGRHGQVVDKIGNTGCVARAAVPCMDRPGPVRHWEE